MKKEAFEKDMAPDPSKPFCETCKYFKCEPEKKDWHYYIDGLEASGQCTYVKFDYGVSSRARGCKHWKMRG